MLLVFFLLGFFFFFFFFFVVVCFLWVWFLGFFGGRGVGCSGMTPAIDIKIFKHYTINHFKGNHFNTFDVVYKYNIFSSHSIHF